MKKYNYKNEVIKRDVERFWNNPRETLETKRKFEKNAIELDKLLQIL